MDSSAFPSMSHQLSKIGGTGTIIYTGNNEIRGALIRACSRQTEHPLQNIRLYRWLQDQHRQWKGIRYQAGQLLEHQEDCIQRAIQKTILQAPKNKGGFRSDPFYTAVLNDFEENLRTTIANFRQVNMHVWLVVPPINLNLPPKTAVIDPAIPLQEHPSIQALIDQKNWAAVLKRDPTHALANYYVGKQKNDIVALSMAAERDYASQRITPSLQEIIVDICTQNQPGVLCVDLRYLQFESSEDFFHDFCHPTREYGINTITQSLLPLIQQHIPE